MAAGHISEDELKRAVGPQIESAKRDRQQNSFWVGVLDNAQKDPRVLAFQRSAESQYTSITIGDIAAEAKRWLKPSTEWKMKVIPEDAAR